MAGVYEWIRDGVRKAVLLGFSDAVEQLGLPEEDAEMNQQLAAQLAERPALAGSTRGSGRGGKKRLGRSLNQLTAPDAA